jgi:MFS family permease
MAGRLTPARTLLTHKPFLALWAARAISFLGDQIATIALVLLIAREHPATAVGGLLLAESLPWLLSAVAGSIADRFERRALMIGCQLGQGLIFGAITIWLPPYAALLALVALASLLGTLLRAAGQSSVPALVRDDDLLAANALLGTALNASVVMGPAIGGALAGLAGPRLALGVDTATFLLSAGTLLWLPLLPAEPIGSGEPAGRGAMIALRYAAADPVLRALLLSTAMLVAFAGVDNVALVFLVRETLGGGSFAFGAAMAAFGVGMLLATAVLVRFPRWPAERLAFGGTAATAAGTTLTGLSPSLGAVYPAQAVAGLGNGIELAAGNTLIQRRTPPAMVGRISGALQMGVASGFLVAYLGGGALIDATSPRTAFLVAGGGSALALLVLRPVLTMRTTVSSAATLEQLYRAFNDRDLDALLSQMTADVDWPNAWEGGRIRGTDGVRDYWTRQWAAIDPRVELLEVTTRADGSVAVDVRQVVRSLEGEAVDEGRVVHVYRFRDGLVEQMDVEEP